MMRYSVLLEPINEPEFQGYYCTHIPTLDRNALAARALFFDPRFNQFLSGSDGTFDTLAVSGQVETKSLIAQVEIPDALLRP